MQAFDRGTRAARGTRVAAVRPRRRRRRQVSVGELPDDAQICNCNGVSKGDIRACVGGRRAHAARR